MTTTELFTCGGMFEKTKSKQPSSQLIKPPNKKTEVGKGEFYCCFLFQHFIPDSVPSGTVCELFVLGGSVVGIVGF